MYREPYNKLETDWSPVESKNGNGALRYEDVDPDPLIVDVVERHSAFFARFYP